MERSATLVAVYVCVVISGLSEWSGFHQTSKNSMHWTSEDVHFRPTWQHFTQEGMGAQLLLFDIKLSTMFLL